jgi:peptidase E
MIGLFADSQLLFWKRYDRLFLNTLTDRLGEPTRLAAYVGASNRDAPEFYEIFQAAMNGAGIHDCRHIRSAFGPDDAAFLNAADLILLAGGDVEAGWNVLESTRMTQVITKRQSAGALLIGISAGAMQLGMHISIEDRLIDSLKLVPFVIDVHDEERHWSSLDRVVRRLAGAAAGLGIPRGGGVIYHPDGTLEAVRYPAYLVSVVDGVLRRESVQPAF